MAIDRPGLTFLLYGHVCFEYVYTPSLPVAHLIDHRRRPISSLSSFLLNKEGKKYSALRSETTRFCRNDLKKRRTKEKIQAKVLFDERVQNPFYFLVLPRAEK